MKIRCYPAIIIAILCFTTALAAREGASVNESEYKHVPLKFSLFPVLDLERKTLVNFSLNLFGDWSTRLEGASLGFGVSIVGEDVRGAQVGGISSIAGGDVSFAQLSWILNSAGGNVTGVQASSCFNFAGGRMKGLQGSGCLNYAGGFTGLQCSVINISTADSTGMQLSTVNVATDKTSGMQMGLVNYASDIRGMQLGLVNVSREMEGVPLGLISIVTNGVTNFDMWGDEMGFVRMGLKHGTRNFYAIYTVGSRGDLGLLSAGLGWGVSIPFDRFQLGVDAIAYNIARTENYFSGDNLLHVQTRLYGGVKIAGRLSLIAGVSYNYATAPGDSDENISIVKTVHGRDYKYDDNNIHWPGFFVGVRM